MQDAIHPTYYAQATVYCSGCGRTFQVGSTQEKINVELCSNCHPFYTGKQKLVDTAGRVDRFRARAAKAAERSPKSEKPAEPSPKQAANTKEQLGQMKQSLEQPDKQQ